MQTGDETDEELMIFYQKGSEEAFAALYSRHSKRIFGYLKSRVRSEQEAMDLFQEVFVKIHKSKHLYNKAYPLLPWVFTVAHSVLIDGLRKLNRKHEVYGFDFDLVPAIEQKPGKKMTFILPQFSELPTNQQKAIQMRYLDEKTFEEIAEILKTTTANARKLISRGLIRLKHIFQEGI